MRDSFVLIVPGTKEKAGEKERKERRKKSRRGGGVEER